MNTQFKHPFSCLIAGPSGSGKSVFTFRLIDEAAEQITPPPHKIVYCYGEYQSHFNNYPHVKFVEGLPDLSQFNGEHRTLLIIDDLMTEAGSEVSNIFTKFSHHRNISCIFLTQNLFYKTQRTMSLNTHYLVLFKNPRDALQVATLGRQMYPNNSKFLVHAFKDATEKPYGYLLLDLRADTLENYRVRTNIFSGERSYVYLPK
jgi:RNA helicase